MKRLQRHAGRRAAWSVLAAAAIGLAACDDITGTGSCAAVDGGELGARVDGSRFCAVTVADAGSLANARQVVGVAADGRVIGLVLPTTTGSFPIASGPGYGGWYMQSPTAGVTYLSGADGAITVTTASATRLAGTFAFSAEGFDQSTGQATGGRVQITDGAFDVAIGQ